MSEQQPPPPGQHPVTWGVRTRKVDAQGNVIDTLITDPLRHRMNDPDLMPGLSRLMGKYPGLLNNKAAMFGHTPKKEIERIKLNYRAAAAIYDAAERVPSWQGLADTWFVSRVEGELELWMGADGAAITAENTNRTVSVSREEKPGKWPSLRR